MKARVGIHLGEVSLRKNKEEDVARGAKPVELEGLAKHIAARIMGCSEGGRTLLSQEAFEVARRGAVGHKAIELEGELSWVKHGSYLLKGSADPRVLCEVGAPEVVAEGPPLAAGAKAQRLDEPTSASGPPAWLWVIVGLVVLGGLGAVFMRGAETGEQAAGSVPGGDVAAASSPQDEGGSEAEEAASAAPLQLHAVVQPEGAVVTIGGVEQGPSPVTVEVPLGTDSVVLEASADGYMTGTTTCTLDEAAWARGSSLCTLSLERARSAAQPRPARQPAVSSTGTPAAAPPPPAEAAEEPAEEEEAPRRPQIQLID